MKRPSRSAAIQRTEPDVVVVGAGVAGLTAAAEVARAGRRVLVLDARERPGGRIDTHHLAGWPIPIEGGAEFEHGVVPTIDAFFRGERGWRRELEVKHSKGQGRPRVSSGDWQRAMELMEAVPQQGRDLSYDELRRQASWKKRASQRVQALAMAFVEGFNAADARVVSAISLGRQSAAAAKVRGDRLFHIVGGYDRLVRKLVDRLLRFGGELRLGACVRRIAWRRRAVELTVESALNAPLGPIRARAAVVSLPVGVLQAGPHETGGVRFAPALPAEKRDAIRAIAMGPVVKVLLRFHRMPPLMARHHATFLHVLGAPVPTFWRAGSAEVPILVGWSAGSSIDRLPSDPSARLRITLETLARALGMTRAEIAADLEAWRIFDWRADPFSRGAYSYIPVGALLAPARLAEPVEDTLFFAGEATHADAAGTVHGAIESGYRAARELLSSRSVSAH